MLEVQEISKTLIKIGILSHPNSEKSFLFYWNFFLLLHFVFKHLYHRIFYIYIKLYLCIYIIYMIFTMFYDFKYIYIIHSVVILYILYMYIIPGFF